MKRKQAILDQIVADRDRLITGEWISGLAKAGFGSWQEFAEEVGRSAKTVWAWRVGKRRPDVLAVRRMLEIAQKIGYPLPGDSDLQNNPTPARSQWRAVTRKKGGRSA